MSITTRQQAVRSLEPGAFAGVTGREDIIMLKRGIYENADLAQILEVVATDADLVLLQRVREPVLARPAMPAENAAAAVSKHYERLFEAFTKQRDALAKLKGQLLKTLDHEAKLVVEQPVHGALRLSVLDIITSLSVEYATLTVNELMVHKDEWLALRWDASSDLHTFLAEFRDRHAFLTTHNYGAQEREQVAQLKRAVNHVTGFVQLANPAFYQAHPGEADQTFANLCATYRSVYREQYANSTAAQFHLANQAAQKQSPTAAGDSTCVEGIMASVRGSLKGATVNATTSELMAKEVAKTIQRILHPRAPAADDRERVVPPLKKGMCHMHPTSHNTISHTFADCSMNPANKKA